MAAAFAASAAWAQAPIAIPAIDVASAGVPFSPGVRGQAAPSINQFRQNSIIGTPMTLAVARGSSIRGVAGGLEADIYDWRSRNLDQRSTTLDYLRFARDYNANLVITTNVRGLTEIDPAGPSATSRRFYDTSIDTVTQTAAEWVRYTNVVAQTYRQGQAITNPQDQAILISLVWNTGPNDTHPILPAVGEAALPKVTYWEIGNEPRVPLANSYELTNSFTFLAPERPRDATHMYDYAERYASMTAAMKAVDPTIKVGPALQTASAISEKELLNSILNRQAGNEFLPVDFIGYHPYQRLYDTDVPAEIEARLQNIYTVQRGYTDNLRAMISAAGRDPNSVELIASEVNVSNWSSNDTIREAQMGHALGTTETVFSFARLGVHDAHYWLWPGDPWDGTEFPVYKAFEGLRDHMGDTLLSAYTVDNARVYTTRSSTNGEIAVWGLNFSNSENLTIDLSLEHLPADGYTAKVMTLKALSGPTTLFSGNLASYMANGPTSQVDWVSTSLTGVNLVEAMLTLPAATISVVLVTPKPRFGDFTEDGLVKGSDLSLWKSNFRRSGTGTHRVGDADADRDVDGADFLTWQRQAGSRFGLETASAGALAVPEPAACVLAIIVGMTACRRVRR